MAIFEITINLSKPEKDPKDIAAAAHAQSGYPACALLCRQKGMLAEVILPHVPTIGLSVSC